MTGNFKKNSNDLLINNSNSKSGSYLKTTDFNNTRASLVDQNSNQFIYGSKYFENSIHIRSSPIAMFIKPRVGLIGES